MTKHDNINSPCDKEWDDLLRDDNDTTIQNTSQYIDAHAWDFEGEWISKWTINDTLIVVSLAIIFGIPTVIWFLAYFGKL